MPHEVPPQANWWGFGPRDMELLFAIAYWRNGLPVTIDGVTKRIGTHLEPTLQEIIDATGGEGWTLAHEDALDRLHRKELLKEEKICRRKVKWAPTEKGLQAMRDVLQDRAEDLRPEWAPERQEGPIYGDPNGLFLHRKGVDAAGYALQKCSFFEDVQWYPPYPDGFKEPDLMAEGEFEYQKPVLAEVVTKHHNNDHVEEKLEALAKKKADLWLIFPVRWMAAHYLNMFHAHDLIELDGRYFSDPLDNHAIETINRTLSRSGLDVQVNTVCQLIGADADTVDEWFEDYYSSR